MLDELRKPFLVIALVLIFLVVLIEASSSLLMNLDTPGAAALNADTPGYGISYLALLDSFVFYITLLIALAMIIPERLQGRVQGCVTAIVSFLGCLGTIFAIITCLIVLIIMVTLLLAPIFGTIAYLAIYGHFDRSGAAVTLSLIMMLKFGFIICLLLAHQRFLQNKGLVLIVLTSLLGNLIISFLHNFVPLPLVSITDAIGAIIVGILALIWAIVLLVFSIIAIIKAIH
ncbi:MAG TPA: hypothetical protein VIW64_07340 [Pyrinomonadaceae bacterium]|jgi:hypothetical protein